MNGDIIKLLDGYALETETNQAVIRRIADGLALRISALEKAMRDGDVTMRTLTERIREKNFSEIEQAIKHNEALLENPYGKRIEEELKGLRLELAFVKEYTKETYRPMEARLPKAARTYLCVDIIVAWKLIKSTEDIPNRTLNSEREPEGEFLSFLRELLKLAGGHVATVNADELHKNIINLENEFKRIEGMQKTEANHCQIVGENKSERE